MWTRSALPLALVFACAATLTAQSPRFGVGRPPTGESPRPRRRDCARRRRLAPGRGNRRRGTHALRRAMRQLSRSERRRRRCRRRARRRTWHARHCAAAEDGRQFLAAGDDGVGLRESRDAVRSARPARAARGLCGRRLHPESQRHRRRGCRDEREDAARSEDAESRRLRRRSAAGCGTDEDEEAQFARPACDTRPDHELDSKDPP